MSAQPKPPRKTLGLTGITLNAMALVAPGALAWLLYQPQLAAQQSGLGGIWPGVLLALLTALVTAFSFGQLARRYPEAGLRSAYHFAEQVFRDSAHPLGPGAARFAKFLTGWASHLYYWVYPGVMVAFMGTLADSSLRQFGYQPTAFGQILLAGSFAAFVGFLALRGITGSTVSSVVLNTLQLITLGLFSVLAIVFRGVNPLELTSMSTLPYILLPVNLSGLAFQAALAMMLMVGFEAVTSLSASAANPGRDIPRASILALLIQGAFSYLLVYFAAGLALNDQIDPASRAPLGELARQIGDAMLSGNGLAFMLVMAFAAAIALLAAMLSATNNGVRISFSMALDSEMPNPLGILHPKYATPYFTVILLSLVSAVLGSFGILGGLPALMGLILAATLGAFLLYAILGVLTVAAFAATPAFHWLKHGLLPVASIALNLGIATLALVSGFGTGGVTAQACTLALGVAAIWMILSLISYFARRR